MVRMLLFDSLIAVGLPGDGNKQLLATITTDPWGLQPSSQNISKPFHPSHPPISFSFSSPFFYIQVLVPSQRHCDQNKTIFQDRVLWENATSIEGGVEGKSGDVFLWFGDLDAWNNDVAYPQFVLLTFVGLGLSNDLRIIICKSNFGQDKYPLTVGEMVHLEKKYSAVKYILLIYAVFNWFAAFQMDSFQYHTVLTKYIQIKFSWIMCCESFSFSVCRLDWEKCSLCVRWRNLFSLNNGDTANNPTMAKFWQCGKWRGTPRALGDNDNSEWGRDHL